jgi:hypothetical protein
VTMEILSRTGEGSQISERSLPVQHRSHVVLLEGRRCSLGVGHT